MVTKTYLKPTYLITYLCDRSASSASSDSSDVSDIIDSSQSSERSDTSDQKVRFQQKNLLFTIFFLQYYFLHQKTC